MSQWYDTETSHRREAELQIERGIRLLAGQLNKTKTWTKKITQTVEKLNERTNNIESLASSRKFYRR